MYTRPYVGIMPGAKRETFRAGATPTETSHGERYLAVIGPFRTMRAARFMADYGRGNPHCLTVHDAEQLAQREAVQSALARLGV